MMNKLNQWYGIVLLIPVGVFLLYRNVSFSSFTPLLILAGLFLAVLVAGIAQFRNQTLLSKAIIILGLVIAVGILGFSIIVSLVGGI